MDLTVVVLTVVLGVPSGLLVWVMTDRDVRATLKRRVRRSRIHRIPLLGPGRPLLIEARDSSFEEWRPLPGTEFDRSGSTWTIASPPSGMRWFGIVCDNIGALDYELSFRVRLASGSDRQCGFGAAPRVHWDGAGRPVGSAVQYDRGFAGFRRLSYPNDFDSTTFDAILREVDERWHRWKLTVESATARLVFDDELVSSIELESSSARGIYLRVWNGKVSVKDIILGPVASA